MKTIVIILACLMLNLMTFGQKAIKETQPVFKGVRNAAAQDYQSVADPVSKYFMERIKYPENAAECCVEGTELVEFVVTPHGNVTDINIINRVCCDIDDEVKRVLESTNGMWIPGEENGQPVATKQEIALAFSMCRMQTGPILEDFKVKAGKWYTLGNNALLMEKKPKKALRAYNNGIRLLPNDHALLFMRGLCNYELGDTELARQDWSRLLDQGGTNISDFMMEGITDLKGFDELTAMFQGEY
jgi:tetratricopeptide (TPR) repeat protein